MLHTTRFLLLPSSSGSSELNELLADESEPSFFFKTEDNLNTDGIFGDSAVKVFCTDNDVFRGKVGGLEIVFRIGSDDVATTGSIGA